MDQAHGRKSTWGTIDLLYASYNRIVLEIDPPLLGAASKSRR